jgi:hypothetical protein
LIQLSSARLRWSRPALPRWRGQLVGERSDRGLRRTREDAHIGHDIIPLRHLQCQSMPVPGTSEPLSNRSISACAYPIIPSCTLGVSTMRMRSMGLGPVLGVPHSALRRPNFTGGGEGPRAAVSGEHRRPCHPGRPSFVIVWAAATTTARSTPTFQPARHRHVWLNGTRCQFQSSLCSPRTYVPQAHRK